MTCPRSKNLPSTWLAAGQRLAPPHHRQRMHPRQRQAPSRTPCTARPIADPPWSAVPWVGVREGQGGDPEAPETARGPIEGAKGRASKPNWRRKCPAIPASPGAPSPFLCDSACSTTLFLKISPGAGQSLPCPPRRHKPSWPRSRLGLPQRAAYSECPLPLPPHPPPTTSLGSPLPVFRVSNLLVPC